MKFSLILATIGRVRELESFLESLAQQNDCDFELLVVDQNSDDRIASLLASYGERFDLRHLTSAPGLSLARNVALRHVTGDVVAFPDDDCVYPPDLLKRVARLLGVRSDLDGISGRCLTPEGVPRGRWPSRPTRITKYNIFGRCISFTMFLRRALVARIGLFDETLGLGANTRWLGAEDYDYLLRAALQGSGIYYDPEIVVVHPGLTSAFAAHDRAKRYGNALGFGRFLAKHQYSFAFVTYYFARYLAGATFNLAIGRIAKAYYRWTTLVGNLEGWFAT
ncbi:MAG: glycosyltransferase family 2 protein [Candidatus Binataceae bacterium]